MFGLSEIVFTNSITDVLVLVVLVVLIILLLKRI
jgi:hypothetical protein